MAKQTSSHLNDHLIYSVYVRNHRAEGSFKALIKDLDRIKSLGTDIIWLMPIHPIGVKNKKGNLGCPYAIKDFKGINPEYGDLEDFKELIDQIHELDMKIMIDVVYNHTSPDALYLDKHPAYYYRKPDGSFGNKIADWSDIIDLDYNNKDLWIDQIDALCYWTQLGVDGYRCDVASLVPVDFWLEARRAVDAINPKTIWLAETVHPHFIEDARKLGVGVASDGEMFQAFDMSYDYDTHTEFIGYLKGLNSLDQYLEKKRMQETIYPENYMKLRFLENHDNPRIKSLIENETILNNWLAFSFFEKGPTMIYAGQEALNTHTPSLFDLDPVDWSSLNQDLCDRIAGLAQLKKDPFFQESHYKIHPCPVDDVILISYESAKKTVIGVFNVGQKTGSFNVNLDTFSHLGDCLPNGHYRNLIDDSFIAINECNIHLSKDPLIFEVSTD